MHDPRAAAELAANPAPVMAPAPEAETETEAEERQQQYEQLRKEHEEEQQRREEERKQQFEREQAEREAEQNRRAEVQKFRQATFERIVDSAPAIFTATQLRVFLRALVNLDPYTVADDVAEHFAGNDENNQQAAEDLLLTTIDGLADDKLTGFALRLALTGHVAIPRENELDFLNEAEAAFAPPKPKDSSKSKKTKTPTPIKPSPRKAAGRKKVAA